MADEVNNAGTTENTGTTTESGTLLTGSDAPAAATEQQAGAQTPADPKAATDQTAKDGEAAGKEGEKKEDEGDKPTPKAPEKYEFKLPEGMPVDSKALEAFEPLARELDLTNEQAQKFVDLQAGLVKAQADAWAATTKAWVDETKNDPEIGGKNLEATLNASKALLKRYAEANPKHSEGLTKLLDGYGIGNHPDMIRFTSWLGKMAGEDTFKNTNTTSTGSRSPEDILYGSN